MRVTLLMLATVRRMSNIGEKSGVFSQTLNPMTNRSEWVLRPEDYDYQQEVARAAFADMLHDSERNRLYYSGLRAAVSLLRSRGEEVHVLDIGTGTGLLSMMAASLGADTITAVEEFRPMAECANRVIADNGFEERIKLVRKRSTDVLVGLGLDMERRANLLVTEVFDTELIGEGAVGTFNHAHRELLTPDCLVVPTSATMYAQVVTSPVAARWNRLHDVDCGDGIKLSVPDDGGAGGSVSLALHDLQLSQFKDEWFAKITDPIPIFRFDFSGRSGSIPVAEQTVTPATVKHSGPCNAVFLWWDCKMDPLGEIDLSCAPKWAHPSPEDMPWRDHWMQAVYYPLSRVEVVEGEVLSVVSNHDEYSLWFDLSKKDKSEISQIPMPNPTPGLHLAVSRTRLGQMNDARRNATFCGVLKRHFSKFPNASPVCLCLGELSLLPLLAVKLGASKVFVVAEKNRQARDVMAELAKSNDLSGKLELLEVSLTDLTKNSLPDKIDLIVGEPNFSQSLLPWHNLLFWYCSNHILGSGNEWAKDVKVVPGKACLWAMPVSFRDLWKIRAPLRVVEGFSMKHFDDIIMNAISVSDASVEPHPLWEYPCRAKARPAKLMEFDLSAAVPDEEQKTSTVIDLEDFMGNVNGITLWMTWHLDDDHLISGGPVSDVVVGKEVEWDLHSKQGVHFFPDPTRCQKGVSRVRCDVAFKPADGDLDFSFSLS